MNSGRLIFTQVTDLIHREQFNRCMDLHPMPRASKGISARDQFLAMVFAEVTFRESLRDIEACLRKLSFAYYFNPVPNDRNLEFDPERNLFPDGTPGTYNFVLP